MLGAVGASQDRRMFINSDLFDPVAQRIEQSISNRWVAGSSPARVANNILTISECSLMVKCLASTQETVGSSPITRSNLGIMTDSKISDEILKILEDANPHIETGAALVGLLTEYMKIINEKVPLKDLLMEVGVFFKSEVVPPVEALEKELFRQRKTTAEGWVGVYEAALQQAKNLCDGDVIAREITLQMMRTSQDVWRGMSQTQLVNASVTKK